MVDLACGGVIAGQARVFGCLQENIAKSGFGDQCKQQVQDREARMQEDYRLDYGVASQCEADVNHYCSIEKVCMQGHVNPLRSLHWQHSLHFGSKLNAVACFRPFDMLGFTSAILVVVAGQSTWRDSCHSLSCDQLSEHRI